MDENIRSFRELRFYQAALEVAMRVLRRSSRSVCANVAEAWRKRRYPAAFVSKLNDAEAEAAETQVWLEIVCKSSYLDQAIFLKLDTACENILGMLVKILRIFKMDDPHLT